MNITAFLLLPICIASAFANNIEIDLSGKWQFEKSYGKVEDSRFSFRNGDLIIDYSFLETSYNSSEHPDYKGRDAYWLFREGHWDFSDLSMGELEYTGNQTPFSFAIALRDSHGVQLEYKQFPWNDPKRRFYRFSLNAPSSGVFSQIDLKNIVKIGIYVDESGEFRYQPNSGQVKIHALKFNSFDREKNIAADFEFTKRLGNKTELERKRDSHSGPISELSKEATQKKYDAIFSDGSKYAIFDVSIWHKLRREFTYFNEGATPLKKLEFSAAGNEYQSAQFVMVPSRVGINAASVVLKNGFVDSHGNHIDNKHVTINIPEFVNTTASNLSYYDYIGETAEIMMPNHQFSVTGGAVQPVWVTVYVPSGTVPGLYQGELSVSAAGKTVVVPMNLTVYDFSLPQTRAMARQFIYWLPAIANFYGFRNGDFACDYNRDGFGIPEEMVFNHLDFLLKYPIDIVNLGWVFDSDTGDVCWPLKKNADGSLNFTLFDKLMEFCRERGMRAFSMGDFGRKAGRIQDLEYQKKVRAVMIPYIAHLKEKGWFKDGNWKILDEPDSEALYVESVEESKFIRSIDPTIPILSAVAIPEKQLMGSVDIWLLRPQTWTDKLAKEVRDSGSEASWYWCVCPFSRPLPNYFINYPATDPRVIEWMHYKVGAKNFIMWALNNWSNNIQPGDKPRWPAIPWNPNTYANFNGDGLFIYPLPGGKLASSMRLDLLREGAEENEYFVLLEKLLFQLEQANKGPEVVARGRELLKLELLPSIYEVDVNPAQMDEIRKQAAKLIVEAQSILKRK